MTDTQQQPMSASQSTDNRTDDTANGHTTNTDNDTTRTYTIEDDITDIVNALLDILRWITSFRLTETICRLLGHGFDPEGCALPEWDFKPAAAAGFTILENEHVQPEGEEGYAVYDGVVYANAKVVTKEPWEEVRLTAGEIITMQQYRPALRNLILAKKIKYHLSNGKNDEQIAPLVGYAVTYVKHYRLAFEKAAGK